MSSAPDLETQERIAKICHARPVAWVRRIGGYSPAERWVATLPDGSTVFAKVATTPLIAGWLRQEARIYAELQAQCMPAIAAFEDDPERPMLIMEDLTYAHWPPPWSWRNVEAVRGMLAEVSATPAPDFLPRASESIFQTGAHWQEVARDPRPFLSLGVCSDEWLESALPVLLAAEASAELEGDSVLHMDVRSDNLCFADEDEPVLIDWCHAARGAAKLDIAFWLPSLQFEGGPEPGSILPGEPGYAALIAGFFAARAGLEVIPDAPFVRRVQREQLSTALPWAIRELELPPLDGDGSTDS